jgi:predicted molibdopterin-dependent oxidoreductase YjgC
MEATSRRVLRHPVLGDLPDAQAVQITVDGQSLVARQGEPIAAVLLASGISVCRTMPESREPRGAFCWVGRCTDCLMTVDGEPNVRACQTAVRHGQVIWTQSGLGEWEGSAR